ncbi:hypothetical protein [Actinophytocola sp.]|nr:hypothetical protein [Actinophytocola sp.]HET9139251.1 hypothetical protein [Actinophytocola sp.]
MPWFGELLASIAARVPLPQDAMIDAGFPGAAGVPVAALFELIQDGRQ